MADEGKKVIMVTGKKSDKLANQENKNLILGILGEFCTDGETLLKFLQHVGFDLGCLSHTNDFPAAYLGHYRCSNGDYDVERACMHLATWPPIAEHIYELLKQRNQGL